MKCVCFVSVISNWVAKRYFHRRWYQKWLWHNKWANLTQAKLTDAALCAICANLLIAVTHMRFVNDSSSVIPFDSSSVNSVCLLHSWHWLWRKTAIELSTMTDRLIEIDRKNLPILQAIYKSSGLKGYLGYLTVGNYIGFFEQDPNVRHVKVYCLNNNFSDGTFVVTVSAYLPILYLICISKCHCSIFFFWNSGPKSCLRRHTQWIIREFVAFVAINRLFNGV